MPKGLGGSINSFLVSLPDTRGNPLFLPGLLRRELFGVLLGVSECTGCSASVTMTCGRGLGGSPSVGEFQGDVVSLPCDLDGLRGAKFAQKIGGSSARFWLSDLARVIAETRGNPPHLLEFRFCFCFRGECRNKVTDGDEASTSGGVSDTAIFCPEISLLVMNIVFGVVATL